MAHTMVIFVIITVEFLEPLLTSNSVVGRMGHRSGYQIANTLLSHMSKSTHNINYYAAYSLSRVQIKRELPLGHGAGGDT